MCLNIQRVLSKSCVALVAAILVSASANASFWTNTGERTLYNSMVYAYPMQDFGTDNYKAGVKWMFAEFELRTGKKLVPGKKHCAGLKIYTNSGDGVQTPLGLTRAVIAELRSRGFAGDEIFILDATESKLRETGYLPPLSARARDTEFEGTEVRCLDSNKWWSKTWFYDNPLPVDYTSEVGREIIKSHESAKGEVVKNEDTRKSFLSAPLIEDVDFWINLPVILDNFSMEVSGGLANATLWSVSNRERFFSSPANAPVAMAEISAIPELIGNWALTILSMEHYQIVGGPIFNSNYVRSDPVILGSADPAVLDAWAVRRMNAYRVALGFKPLSSPPFASSFARLVGVGSSDSDKILWILPVGAVADEVLSNPDRVGDPSLNKPRADTGLMLQRLNYVPIKKLQSHDDDNTSSESKDGKDKDAEKK
jgi:hypothetical protein